MRRITLVAAALCVAAGAPVLADEDSQGFLRVVEGAATLIRVEDGQPEAARENTPALAGDRLSLAPGSRVEVILPDGHRLRLAESADLELVALARSLDENSAATALQLSNGALAIDVPREAVDRTRVDTEAAAVLLERGGLYLVEIDQQGATRVVVREGEAEVLTEYDTTLVRAGDEAVIDPESRARVALYQAPPLTDVEEWARQLEAEAARAQVAPVEPELRYAAQPLGRYGSWVDAGAGYAWRPRVEVGWRPYWRGYWKYSPAGLVWCSYEPWGWVPYHYGSWDLHPSYGWLWYPGAVYRPAHVVWYWGSSYAGWVPSGYYASFYARRFGFHALLRLRLLWGFARGLERLPRLGVLPDDVDRLSLPVPLPRRLSRARPSWSLQRRSRVHHRRHQWPRSWSLARLRRGGRDVGAPGAPPDRWGRRSSRRERGGGAQPRGFGNDAPRARQR